MGRDWRKRQPPVSMKDHSKATNSRASHLAPHARHRASERHHPEGHVQTRRLLHPPPVRLTHLRFLLRTLPLLLLLLLLLSPLCAPTLVPFHLPPLSLLPSPHLSFSLFPLAANHFLCCTTCRIPHKAAAANVPVRRSFV
ncbi:unnamed protein product [Closterium sp. NIES-53]